MSRLHTCLATLLGLVPCTGFENSEASSTTQGDEVDNSQEPDTSGSAQGCQQTSETPNSLRHEIDKYRHGPYSGPVSAALATARRHHWDKEVNPVTFRSMDAYFETRIVHASRPRTLPYKLMPLDMQVNFEDATLDLEGALVRTHTNALLVIKNGYIVYERHLNGGTEQDRYAGWSVSKSVTSLLFGMARDRGYFKNLSDPIELYLPELKGSAFEGASLEDLLRMRAGTSYKERRSEGPGDLARLSMQSAFTNRSNFTDFGELGLTKAHPPGEMFNYSTLSTGLLAKAIERETGFSLPVLTEYWLWRPAGMEHSAYWLMDLNGPEAMALAGGGFNASLRDFGRLGLLVLNQGRAGCQIVSEDWVRVSTSSIGDEAVIPGTNRRYGYHWWKREDSPVIEARGIFGQFISIDPQTQTVIVQMSHWPSAGSRVITKDSSIFLEAIRAAVSKE